MNRAAVSLVLLAASACRATPDVYHHTQVWARVSQATPVADGDGMLQSSLYAWHCWWSLDKSTGRCEATNSACENGRIGFLRRGHESTVCAAQNRVACFLTRHRLSGSSSLLCFPDFLPCETLRYLFERNKSVDYDVGECRGWKAARIYAAPTGE